MLLILEKFYHIDQKMGECNYLYTMFFVMLGWVLFRSDSISSALVYIRFMFVFGCKGFIDAMCIQYFKQNALHYIMEILCCMPVFKNIDCIFFKNVVYNAIEPSSITSNKKSGKKVLLIGDSFSKHMNDIMSLYFSEVHTVNVWSFTTDQLNQYQHDIIVWEYVERYTDHFRWIS